MYLLATSKSSSSDTVILFHNITKNYYQYLVLYASHALKNKYVYILMCILKSNLWEPLSTFSLRMD